MPFTQVKNRRRPDSAETKQALTQASRRIFARARPVILSLAILAGISTGAHALWIWSKTSATFALQSVTVSGQKRAAPSELVRLSGVTLGQNLLDLEPKAVERAIAAHPWIRSVEVSRRLPATLSVQIEEHVPAAMVVLGDLYLVDSLGEPFKRIQADDALDLPLITGLDRDAYVEDPATVSARLREALEVIGAWTQGSKTAGRLSEVRLEEQGITLISGAGEEIRLGSSDYATKLERLDRVRSELVRRGVTAEVIHLDNRARPGWVAVKLSTPVSERSGGR